MLPAGGAVSRRRNRSLLAALTAAFLACGEAAEAQSGSAQLDSSSFLKRSTDRADSSTTLTLAPLLHAEGGLLEGRLDLRAITFLSDTSSFTVEAPDAYVATGPGVSTLHQISLGRRSFDWSTADDQWSLGLWSPRFLWDPLRPEKVGMTGLFYNYRSSAWRISAFGTPLGVPERGFPIREDRGRLVSSSPFNIPVPERLPMMGQEVGIHYAIAQPPLGELLLRPGAAVSVRYGADSGAWVSGSWGVLPMNPLDLAVDAKYSLPENRLNAKIRPRALHHHLATGEVGYRAQRWSVWGSLSHENPLRAEVPEGWIGNAIGPAWVAAAGGALDWDGRFSLNVSYLRSRERKPAPDPDEMQMDLGLASRLPYQEACKLGWRWAGMSKLNYDLSWIFDIAESSHLVSLDVDFGTGAWQFGLGTDFLATSTGRGHIGQYEGNDRVRGRIAYAF